VCRGAVRRRAALQCNAMHTATPLSRRMRCHGPMHCIALRRHVQCSRECVQQLKKRFWVFQISHAQSNLGRAASQSPPLVTVGRLKFTPNCPFFDDHHPIIHRLTPLTIANSIRIHSAVLPQYTLRSDRPTDRQTDRPTDMFRHISRLRSPYTATQLNNSL